MTAHKGKINATIFGCPCLGEAWTISVHEKQIRKMRIICLIMVNL